jgi:DNA-binding response OmpR family regulator
MMNERPDSTPWQPKPFTVAVLESDEYLADTLCGLLRDSGFVATAFYDIASLMQMQMHQTSKFDAYVLDYLADWLPQSRALEHFIGAIRAGTDGDVPIFVLGNQAAPERVERLENIIMRYKVRYVLKPLRASYLAKRIGEALARRAGL